VNVRPEGRLVFDNPDAAGMIDLRGFGCDWTFEARRQEAALSPTSWAPEWIHEGTEIVPGLNVLTLRGQAPPAAMSLSGVTIGLGDGYWGVRVPAWQPRAAWLAFVDGRAGQNGWCTSTGIVQPRLCVRFIDYLPTAAWTGQSSSGINLLGDGSEEHGYSLFLPVQSTEYKFPRLYRGQPGAWTLVDEFERADAAAEMIGWQARGTEVWIEECDGQLVIRFGGIAEPWVYQPESGCEPLAGPWNVAFEAHIGLVNVAEIAYPTSGVCTAAHYIDLPADCNPLPGQVIAEETFGGPASSVVWLTNGGQIKPEVTLQTADVHQRPIVRVVHEFHEATLTSRPMDTPIDTETRKATLIAGGLDPAELVGLRWRRNLWRDWQFRALIRDPHEYWEGALKPNMPVTVHAGWDGSLTELMTAYLTRPKPIRQPAPSPTLFDLECRDYITARLAGKKFLLETCSPEGWDLGAWAEWQIVRAGCGLSTSFPSGTIVTQQSLGEIAWRRGATDDLVTALDEVFAAHGWAPLAIDADNTIWSGPEPAYSGTPDFTLDESTASGDDIIVGLDVELEDAEFRNMVAGESEAGLIRTWAEGWNDPDDPDFVGDDWWHAERRGGDSANALAAWAQEELRRRLQTRQVLTWTRLAAPADVWPGAYVEVTVDHLAVPAGTIMRVVSDEGELRPGRLEGWATYVCERVDTG